MKIGPPRVFNTYGPIFTRDTKHQAAQRSTSSGFVFLRHNGETPRKPQALPYLPSTASSSARISSSSLRSTTLRATRVETCFCSPDKKGTLESGNPVSAARCLPLCLKCLVVRDPALVINPETKLPRR